MKMIKFVSYSILQFILMILYHGCDILLSLAALFHGILRFIGWATVLMGIIQYKEFMAYLQESPDHILFVIVMSIIFVCIMFMPAAILMFMMDKCEDGIDKLSEWKVN